MSITSESELIGMKKVSDAVAYTFREMKNFVKPGMTTKELDDFGASILKELGANSAPFMLPETYGKAIGKASVTGYCIKFKALKDINIDILEAAILDGVK